MRPTPFLPPKIIRCRSTTGTLNCRFEDKDSNNECDLQRDDRHLRISLFTLASSVAFQSRLVSIVLEHSLTFFHSSQFNHLSGYRWHLHPSTFKATLVLQRLRREVLTLLQDHCSGSYLIQEAPLWRWSERIRQVRWVLQRAYRKLPLLLDKTVVLSPPVDLRLSIHLQDWILSQLQDPDLPEADQRLFSAVKKKVAMIQRAHPL